MKVERSFVYSILQDKSGCKMNSLTNVKLLNKNMKYISKKPFLSSKGHILSYYKLPEVSWLAWSAEISTGQKSALKDLPTVSIKVCLLFWGSPRWKCGNLHVGFDLENKAIKLGKLCSFKQLWHFRCDVTSTWSPAPTSSSSLCRWTPWAISGDCCSSATKTLQVL